MTKSHARPVTRAHPPKPAPKGTSRAHSIDTALLAAAGQAPKSPRIATKVKANRRAAK